MKPLDLISLKWNPPPGSGEYIIESELCDLSSRAVCQTTTALVKDLPSPKVAAITIYHFVKDCLVFQFQKSIHTKASEVLAFGGGDSLAKSIITVSMMRLAHIPARFSARIMTSSFLSGLYVGIIEKIVPRVILGAYPEIFLEGKWIGLEGVTLDKAYLEKILTILPPEKPAKSFGIADNRTLEVMFRELESWEGSLNTRCQSQAVIQELGKSAYIEPYILGVKKNRIQKLLESEIVYPTITKNIARIRMK